MMVEPMTPLLQHLDLKSSKTDMVTARSGKTPTGTHAPWTWRRILRAVRYVSLYYLFTVIEVAFMYEGFVQLAATGRSSATGVIAAGNVIRMVATAVANVMWPTRHNLVLLEFCAVTVASTLYIFNTIDIDHCGC